MARLYLVESIYHNYLFKNLFFYQNQVINQIMIEPSKISLTKLIKIFTIFIIWKISFFIIFILFYSKRLINQ